MDKYRPNKPLNVTRLKLVEKPSIINTVTAMSDDAKESFAVVHQPALNSRIKMPPPSLDIPVHPTDQPIFNIGLFPIGRQQDGFIPCNNSRPIALMFTSRILWTRVSCCPWLIFILGTHQGLFILAIFNTLLLHKPEWHILLNQMPTSFINCLGCSA